MNLKQQKEIASRKLKVGKGRLILNPEFADEIKEAITGEDIRQLIKKGLIKIKKLRGQSKYKSRINNIQKKKGRQKGHGTRKGTKKARLSDKKKWILKIRGLRKELKSLKTNEKITTKEYRKLYVHATSGVFRNKKHMKLTITKMRESGE
jgi:large subunit ribosomal protein L19e